jgi:hypothetical protein
MGLWTLDASAGCTVSVVLLERPSFPVDPAKRNEQRLAGSFRGTLCHELGARPKVAFEGTFRLEMKDF